MVQILCPVKFYIGQFLLAFILFLYYYVTILSQNHIYDEERYTSTNNVHVDGEIKWKCDIIFIKEKKRYDVYLSVDITWTKKKRKKKNLLRTLRAY